MGFRDEFHLYVRMDALSVDLVLSFNYKEAGFQSRGLKKREMKLLQIA